MMCTLLALAALSLGACLHETQADNDWCSLNCPEGEMNTMCRYKPRTETSNCRNIISTMDGTKRKAILHLHNDYRNNMANGVVDDKWPTASNMRQMSWDYDLERLALRWAQQCTEGHDTCRRTPSFRCAGQNYGMAGSTGAYRSSNISFSQWVSEISDTTPEIVSSFEGGIWGHFTQVIWATSYKLGCAEVHYEEEEWKKTVLICNYGPGGNIIGSSVYEPGEPCTGCDEGTKCENGSTYPELCAPS